MWHSCQTCKRKSFKQKRISQEHHCRKVLRCKVDGRENRLKGRVKRKVGMAEDPDAKDRYDPHSLPVKPQENEAGS